MSTPEGSQYHELSQRIWLLEQEAQRLNERITEMGREMVKSEDHLNNRINRLQAEVALLP